MSEASITTAAGDVEEPADRWIHRPLAYPLVSLFSSTPITPNHVTILSGASGVLAAMFIASSGARPAFRLVGAALFLSSAVFDCADGQLARVRGRSTPEGSALDGMSDELVGFAVIFASTFVLAGQYGGVWWLVGAAAMFSSSLQCMMFDAAKERYVARFGVAHAASKLAMADRQQPSEISTGGDGWLLRIFDGYVRRIRWLIAQLPANGATDRQADRRRIRTWTTLGLGTHIAYGYAALVLSFFWLPALAICLLMFSIVMNAQLAWLIRRDRRSARIEVA